MYSIRYILMISLVGLLVNNLQAQPRSCLDLTSDRVVGFDDVRGGLRGASLLDLVSDPRADFDFRQGVNVIDVVNQFLVASGRRPALLDFAPRAVSPGQTVRALVQNISADTPGLRVVLTTTQQEFVVDNVAVQDSFLTFVMPNVGDPGTLDLPDIELALPVVDRRGLVLVRVEANQLASNVCPILVLRPGEGDRDGDGLRDGDDTCPDFFDPQNGDTDDDGLGDFCDNCVATFNPDQADSNGDGSGDACEPPGVVFIGGRIIEPAPGVDSLMLAIDADVPHGVLVLTREIDMAIEEDLEEQGVHILNPVARNVFIVGVERRAFDQLPEFSWFRGLFPLNPQLRLVGELREVQPNLQDSLLLEIAFHNDIELDSVRVLLQAQGVEIVNEGVDLRDKCCGRLLRRVNKWRVRLSGRVLPSLAALDQVLTIQRDYPNIIHNATSRAASNVDVVNTGGLNGSGQTLGEWDGGWSAGDNSAPPPAPAGGVNPALSGRVMVRDHGTLEGIPAPVGCAATDISCTFPFCSYANHGTHVSGTMIGNGLLLPSGTGLNRGMASQAQLISYEWPDGSTEAVCERQDAISNFSTVAHNHSWGYCNGCNNTLGFYDGLSSTYDEDIRDSPEALEVFSAANSQNFRNTGAAACSIGDFPCVLPPIYTAPACGTPPGGVTPPPLLAPPPANVANRFYTVNAPGATTKNGITVANVEFTNNRLRNSSSMGPTQDGRLKPEISANGANVTSTCVPGLTDGVGTCGANGYMGMSGTSMAAPVITGIGALLQERAQALSITPFESTDLKAMLIHTATDLGVHPGAGGAFLTMAGGQWQVFGGVDGPDFLTGYGLANAQAARDHLNSGNIAGMLKPTGCPTSVSYASIPFNSPVAVGGPGPVAGCPAMIWDVVWYIDVPAGMTELKVTITWNDEEATAGANPTLVNDIDLMVSEPSGSMYHYPWWFDPACPYRQAVRVQDTSFNPATFGDHRNTVEQVHVVAPGTLAVGQWRIIIRTDGLVSGTQPFSMMVSLN